MAVPGGAHVDDHVCGGEAGGRFGTRTVAMGSLGDMPTHGLRRGSGQVAGQLAGVLVAEQVGRLRLSDGGHIRVRFSPRVIDGAYNAMSRPGDEKLVVLTGEYLVKDLEFVEMISVDDIIAIDVGDSRLVTRLAELLSDDISGECDAVNPQVARAALDLLNDPLCPPRVHVFPLERGGLELVWSAHGVRRSIEMYDLKSIDGWVFDTNDSSHNREWSWASVQEAKAGLERLFDE